jgi:hypothetical protein
VRKGKFQMPNSGDTFTQEQAFQIVNWYDLANDDTPWEITNNWHKGPDGGGAFFPAAKDWGYEDGFPIYAGIKIDGRKYHVYWIRNQGVTHFWVDPNTPG